MSLKIPHWLALLLLVSAFATPTEEEPAPAAPPQETRSAAELEAGNQFAQGLMLQALELIGVRYRYGGSTPETGLDCSGFIRYVFQQTLNIALPHNAFAISRLGEEVEKEALKPGDLVFFNTLGRRFSHVGIYLGDDRFIHAPSTGRRIEVVRMTEKYWSKRYTGARRVTQETVDSRRSKLAELMKSGNEWTAPPKKPRRNAPRNATRKTAAKPKPGVKKPAR